ncbi:hypothetical protein PC118_g2115 [Phytophthora cactorum]|uniref:Uncharacterized protein n=2 Tax=Phytophthora cactorum TaxID=29920 RepID=A0A8T1GHN0_9STRA|nr:hypothetical protein PC118_g2115 [Phytophthora cactorum]
MDAREEMTPGQKQFVVRCYQLMDIEEARAAFGIHRTRELVAKCLGIAHGTVSTVMRSHLSVEDLVPTTIKTKCGTTGVVKEHGFLSLVNGRMEAGFVQNPIKCWNASLKREADVEEDEDYHGNFDTPKFERWFTKLCITLKEQHGPCRIHMDGASYHKNIINKNPTMDSNRAEMHAGYRKRSMF